MEIIKTFFDSYSLKARLAPSITAVLFFTFLYFNFIKSGFEKADSYSNLISETLVGISVLFIFTSFIRSIGKYLIEHLMFNGKLNMPTTQLLINDSKSKISTSKRKQIYKFFVDDLKFDIEERKLLLKGQPEELKKEISEAMAIIRNKIRDNDILFRSNQTYGLWRNFSGAICLSIIILIPLFALNVFWFFIPNHVLLVSIAACLILLTATLYLTKKYAYEYAENLFTVLLHRNH